MSDRPPPEVERLAARRAEARRSRDFSTADDLKSAIEDAGWKVIDTGLDYELVRARPADVEVGGRVYYGASTAVPSRLGEPHTRPSTVILVAGDEREPIETSLAAVRAAADAGSQVVVVADGPSPSVAAALDAWGETADVVPVVDRLNLGGAWNAGLRRASGAVIVLVGRDVAVTGDVVAPAVAALSDERVGVAGCRGLSSTDVRRWEPDAGPDVDAVDADAICFRRSDAAARGPLDERFASARLLAAWWSLVLRDEGESEPPRVARVIDLPVRPTSDAEDTAPPDERAERRDRYRLIDRFGRRRDLLRAPVRPTKAGSTGRRR